MPSKSPASSLALVEGAGAVITVHRKRTASDRVISINGVNVAGTNPVLRATQKLQAHLPVCLHPSPRSVLQIGFGSGGTCYSVSLHPEVESIEVVELNPDVLRVASEWFGDINHGVLKDPRVRTRIADAKSYVAATDRTHDLILSDSTHPRFRGNAAAHTPRLLRPLLAAAPARRPAVDLAPPLRPVGRRHPGHPQEHPVGLSARPGLVRELRARTRTRSCIASQQPIAIDPDRLGRRLAAGPVAQRPGRGGDHVDDPVARLLHARATAQSPSSPLGEVEHRRPSPARVPGAPRSLRQVAILGGGLRRGSRLATAEPIERVSRRRPTPPGVPGWLEVVCRNHLEARRPVVRARKPRRRGVEGVPPRGRSSEPRGHSWAGSDSNAARRAVARPG